MKILIYGLNFAPEPTGIGKYTGEMAPWLAGRSNEVRVISAPPYYPAWSVGDGYSAWRAKKETWKGLQVWRTPIWVPARPSGLKRLLHLASFALMSLPALARQLAWKPDVVVVVAPAFACAPGAWLAARLSGAKAWLHIQDFEIDAAFRLGLMKGRRTQKVMGGIERWLLRRFDRVSTISGRMVEVLATKGVDAAKVVTFPNWVDVSAITPLIKPSAYRAKLGIAPDAVVALFSGSMGAKQGLEMLPEAARAVQKRLPNLVFVLCGEGVCKPMLTRESADLPNVRLLPLQPAAWLGELLGLADIHLLTQQAQAADLVMPSKLTGMFSSGRPVLVTAHPGTELASVVQGRGLVVPPDNLQAFVDALIELTESEPKRTKLGAEARRYAESHLARDRVLEAFEQELTFCVGKAAAPAAAHVTMLSASPVRVEETAKSA